MKRGDAAAVAPAARLDARIAALRGGDRATLARAISEVENGTAGARALLEALAPEVGTAHVIGITGPPGAGKSTLINAMLRELVSRGERVGVVAIDPSSSLSGGAVLGDRVRMTDASAAEAVFIRSLASRGHLGGLAATTHAIVDVLDAAGFPIVIVETVGAGQSDVDIAALADTTVVVCPPGLGDDVQAIKAGILEIGDVLVVNKGDVAHAERTERELRDMLHLRKARETWRVPVVRTVATTGEGVARLVDVVASHAQAAGAGRRVRARRAAAGDTVAIESPAHTLAQRDRYLRFLGIDVVHVGPGTATLRMRVRDVHLNFNGTGHGGAIFSLADSAFGLASNSHGIVAAAVDAHITYQVAVVEGDVLTARAVEVSRRPKFAVYRVDVLRADGTPVSSVTGSVSVTRRTHPPAGAASATS
jgi:LAO/AO transport system ATPase/phenylacetic acid degradation protein PaaD